MTAATSDYHPSDEEVTWENAADHLDEAEFMFEIWEAAFDAPNYSLEELAAGPERRLLAHVDALEVGGPAVVDRLLWPTIADTNAWCERVAAATLAVHGVDARHLQRLASILVSTEHDDQRRGLMRALELVANPKLDAELLGAIRSPRGSGTAAALELLASRRARVGDWIGSLLASDEPAVARAAARLVRHSPDRRVLDGLGPLAQADDPALRHAALETALCRQIPGAWQSAVYWALTPGDSPFRRDALTWVAILGDAGAQQRLLSLLDSGEHRADALWALGFGGRVGAIDRCIELLDDEVVGRLAAEVICAIAGLPTDDDSLWTPAPTLDEAQTLPELRHDDLDRDLVPEPEAALPCPDPHAIAQWWQACQAGFDRSIRYLSGRPFTGPALLEVLALAPLRRRHVLAFELELRTGGALALDTRRFCADQQAQLAAFAEVELPNFQRGLPLGA